MKGDRLDAVLRVRKVQEDLAKAAAALAASAAADAEAKVDDRVKSVGLDWSGPDVQALAWDALDRARIDRAAAAAALAARRHELSAAAQRVKGLERLLDKREAADKVDRNRRLAAQSDDLTTARRREAM